MRIKYAETREIRDAAGEVGLRISRLWETPEKGLVEVVVAPASRYAVIGTRGRVVCIHGYEAFIEALLERVPRAVVKTNEVTYLGLADFDRRQDEIMELLEAKYGSAQECGCES